jgi:hypothetical protein
MALLLSTRLVVHGKRLGRVAAPALCAIGAIEGLRAHPDELSYVNRGPGAYLDISESNIDWGQGLIEARRWIDEHAPCPPVSLAYFGSDDIGANLGDRAQPRPPEDGPPDDGTYIVSPVFVVGTYGARKADFADLRARTPDAVIGRSLLVYRMGRCAGGDVREPR